MTAMTKTKVAGDGALWVRRGRRGTLRLPRRRRSGRGGFTLTEIMIALGVLAIGMGMAAGAFHAGIQNHIITVDEIHRTMIGENAIAIAKARLSADVPELPPPLANGDLVWRQLSTDELGDKRLGPQDLQYGRHGFFPLGARVSATQNDFKFMVIIYEILGLGGAQQINVDLKQVKDVPIMWESQTGKWVAVIAPDPYHGIMARTILPVGALVYMPELEDPFVEVTGHIGMNMAILDRELKAETRDLMVMRIEGIQSAQLKIRGVYRGRTSLRPAQGPTGPAAGG
jgi:prepilin-type N-terminal cleavage/methylation domain-containing protein